MYHSAIAALRPAELVTQEQSLDLLRQFVDEAVANAVAPNTRRLYDADWKQYVTWCLLAGFEPLPADPQAVGLYLIDLSRQVRDDGRPRLKPSSISRHLAAISYRNNAEGFGSGLGKHPHVVAVMSGIRRLGDATVARCHPILLEDFKTIVAAMRHNRFPDGTVAARDTLALGIGFAGAMRRSEVAALRTKDVCLDHDGLRIFVAESKTDQVGEGVTLAIPYGNFATTCIPCALVRWSRLVACNADRSKMMQLQFRTGGTHGWKHVCREGVEETDPNAPLLRRVDKHGNIHAVGITGGALNEVVKRRMQAAGYDPAPYGYHSLRAGFVTQARRNGADTRSIKHQTRHGSDAMVELYDREYNPLQANAVLSLGL